MNNGIQSLENLARVARIVLIVFAISGSLSILLQLGLLALSGASYTTVEIYGVLTVGVNVVLVIAFLISIVIIPLWVHRAHTNLHEAGLDGLNYNPAWATLSFFIPFVNLYVPFASTRELYNRSHGKSDWHAKTEAGDVTSWAACNWGALVVFMVGFGYFAVNAVPGVYVMLPEIAWIGLTALTYLLVVGSAFFLMQVVCKVTAAQEAGYHYGQSDVFD